MRKKVLFIGFSNMQLELARKFVTFRAMNDAMEIHGERDAVGAVDAYVINGDDASAPSRLSLHVRSNPRPVLGIGSHPAQGATVFAAGAFKPASVDRLVEMLNAGPQTMSAQIPAASAVSAQVMNFPRANAPVVQADVLVVDDSELVRRTLLRKINEYGHATETAANGEEAMAMLLGNTYRIVFLDVMMPGLDGLEICRRIKRSPEYKATAVYMLTSKDGMFDRVRATMAGCDGYLVKPLESRRLREVLEKYFDRPTHFSPSSLMAKEPFNAVEIAAIQGLPKDWNAAVPKEEFQVTFAQTVPFTPDSVKRNK